MHVLVQTNLMISKQSQELKKTLHKETLDPKSDLHADRKSWEDYAATLPLANGVLAKAEQIAQVSCLWLTPENCHDDKLVIYAHGGGLIAGSIITHQSFVSHLAKRVRCKFLLVNYGLLPENPHSKPVQDLFNVTNQLIKNGGYQSCHIVLGGDSSGAAIALSTLLKMRDHERTKGNKRTDELPSGFFSISGAFDISLKGESITSRNALDPILSHEVLLDWQQRYFAGQVDLTAPEISPLHSDMSDLPPMLLMAGDHEVWLSDTLELAAKAQAQGGKVATKIFKEMWHVFPTHVEIPEAIEAMGLIGGFLDWV